MNQTPMTVPFNTMPVASYKAPRLTFDIPLPDPYAELKAAHKAGKVIQVVSELGEWNDAHLLYWNLSPDRYRIKPEPTPDADGWIPHDGKSVPDVGTQLCEFECRDGYRDTNEGTGKWNDQNFWIWETCKSEDQIIRFRIKRPAEKKYRPWNYDTCEVKCDVRWKSAVGKGNRTFVASCNETGLWLGGAFSQISYQEAFEDMEKLDGTPCGEEVK